jgi:DNA repair protein RadC
MRPINLQLPSPIKWSRKRSYFLSSFTSLATGGLTGTVADPRLILATGLKLAAYSVILSHSHPSGNLNPSNADIQLTSKIKVAADYHDIKVLDHIIIASEGFLSFADKGLL